MRVPERLVPLMDMGVIDELVRPLMSGKEAQVYLVVAGGEHRIAKVYKDAERRSFKHRAVYTEGRRTRDSREQRAMDKRSRHGMEKIEEAWRSAEADAIDRLRAAGVRVPVPHAFIEGVLVMELVMDPDGEPAPRLADLRLSRADALALNDHLMQEVARMLCAGLVHGDLSDFNVLMGWDGPVIIDFPQAVDAARNQAARSLLIRDTRSVTGSLARFAPELRGRQYGEEIWSLYERNRLEPGVPLTGRHQGSSRIVEASALLRDLRDVEREERQRRGIPDPAEAPRGRPARPAPGRPAPRPVPSGPEVVQRPAGRGPEGVQRPATRGPEVVQRPGARGPEVVQRPGARGPEVVQRPGARGPEGVQRPAPRGPETPQRPPPRGPETIQRPARRDEPLTAASPGPVAEQAAPPRRRRRRRRKPAGGAGPAAA